MVDMGMWLDMLFTMLFSPEDYELKKSVYGIKDFDGFEFGNPKKEEMIGKLTAAEEAWEVSKNLPAGPEKDLIIHQIIDNFTDGLAINGQTLLHPDLLNAISINPAEKQKLDAMTNDAEREAFTQAIDSKMAILDTIIEETSAHNIEAVKNGQQLLDPYVVANWLWSKSEFETTEEIFGDTYANLGRLPGDLLEQNGFTDEAVRTDSTMAIKAAITSLGETTKLTGNEYLSIMIIDNDGIDIDGDGNKTFIGPNNAAEVIEDLHDKLALADTPALPEADSLKIQMRHMREAMDINTSVYTDTLKNINSLNWTEAERTISESLMEQLNYPLTAEDKPADDRDAEIEKPKAAPAPDQPAGVNSP